MNVSILRGPVTTLLGAVATALCTLLLLSGCAGATAGDPSGGGSGISGPQAADDRVAIVADGNVQTIDLYGCSGSGVDDLGFPEAVVTFFGGGTSGIPATFPGVEAVVTTASGDPLSHLTITTNGRLRIQPEPGASGAFTLRYSLANHTGDSSAEIDISIAPYPEAPLPRDDQAEPFLWPRSDPVSGTVALRANDEIGAPGALVTEFSEATLVKGEIKDAPDNRLPDYQIGDSAAFAGGTLSVTPGGLLSFANWTEAGRYTFVYTLENQYTVDHSSPGDYSARVEIAVEGPPGARDDWAYPAFHKSAITFNVITGIDVNAGSSHLELRPDVRGYADGSGGASVVSYGGLDFEALDGSVGDVVTLVDPSAGDVKVSIDAQGLLRIEKPEDPPVAGEYRLEYTLANEFGASGATLTLIFP